MNVWLLVMHKGIRAGLPTAPCPGLSTECSQPQPLLMLSRMHLLYVSMYRAHSCGEKPHMRVHSSPMAALVTWEGLHERQVRWEAETVLRLLGAPLDHQERGSAGVPTLTSPKGPTASSVST